MAEEYLLVTDGAAQGTRLDLTGATVTIGREEGTDLVLDDSQASRRHAEVAKGGAGWVVRDLGSTNGTFVNGARVGGDRALRPGDEITIGRSRIALRSTAAHTEIGSPEGLGFTDVAPAPPAPAAPAAAAPAPVAQAAPPPPPRPAAPPPPPPPPAPATPGLAAPHEEHGYPAARPLTGHHGPPGGGPPPPAYRAAPHWQGQRIPGERDPASGIRALRSDAAVRQRAYLVTFVVLALVALAVVLYLISRA